MLNFETERDAKGPPFSSIVRIEKKSAKDTPDEITCNVIYSQNPSGDAKLQQTLSAFCFPWPKNPIAASRNGFSFCMVDSDRRLSYCFAFLQVADQNRSITFVVVSDFYHPDFLTELVRIVASDKFESNDALGAFVTSLRGFTLEMHSYDWIFRPPAGVDMFSPASLELCAPINEVGKLLKFMFSNFSPNYILALIAALMMDCRVIVVSSVPELLGRTCYGILSLFYPIMWPGTFIPLCPEAMLAATEAPFAYIIGVHSSLMDRMINDAIDQYFVLNCDTHEGAIVGMDDFPGDVIQECDGVSEEIRELFRTYKGVFPAAEVQMKLRNYMLTLIGNAVSADWSNPQILYDGIAGQREKLGDDFASFLSQSQFIDGMLREALEEDNTNIQEAMWPGFDFSSVTINSEKHAEVEVPRQRRGRSNKGKFLMFLDDGAKIDDEMNDPLAQSCSDVTKESSED